MRHGQRAARVQLRQLTPVIIRNKPCIAVSRNGLINRVNWMRRTHLPVCPGWQRDTALLGARWNGVDK